MFGFITFSCFIFSLFYILYKRELHICLMLLLCLALFFSLLFADICLRRVSISTYQEQFTIKEINFYLFFKNLKNSPTEICRLYAIVIKEVENCHQQEKNVIIFFHVSHCDQQDRSFFQLISIKNY